MTTKTMTKVKSRIFDAVHETASDLHRLGFIDKRKMAKFDCCALTLSQNTTARKSERFVII